MRRRGRSVLLAAGALGGMFVLGAWLRGTPFFSAARDFVVRSPSIASNALSAALVTPERIELLIQPEHFAKLARKRQEALQRSYLITAEDDLVPATIQHDGRSLHARVRLKGDHVDHLRGNKWSFRVDLRDDGAVLGMSRFSLHHPDCRNFLAEWLYHETLRREGLAALRYEFVSVAVNDTDLGVYAIEEHFDSGLLENNGLLDGPIVRFNEEYFWLEMARQGDAGHSVPKDGSGGFAAADVDAFRSEAVLTDSIRRDQFLRAAMQLELFRSGVLKTSDVFDVDRLARFFAVSDLLGAEHGLRWHNARFAYDPLSRKLAPIGFDGNALTPIQRPSPVAEGVWVGAAGAPPPDDYYALLFADDAFLRAWVAAVARITAPGWLEELLAATADGRAEHLAILHKEFPGYEPQLDVLYANRDLLSALLDPARAVLAYAHLASPLELDIEIAAVQGLPIELLEVVRGAESIQVLQPPRVLPARRPGVPASFASFRIPLPRPVIGAEAFLAELGLRLRVLGGDATRTEAAVPWRRLPESATRAGAGDLEQLPCLDVRAGEVHLRPGVWVLDRELVVPAGCVFRACGGVEVDLVRGATIRSAAPLEWLGEAERPIVLRSSDNSGGGLELSAVDRRSTLQHVRFEGFAGSVALRGTRAMLNECHVAGSRAPAALSIERGAIELEACMIEGAQGTALSAAFAECTLRRCGLLRSGGDAIAIRGGNARIEETTVDSAGGRGLDATEGAQVGARNLHVRRASVGVACRDLAAVELTALVFEDCRVGFAAFASHFGPGAIRGEGLNMTGVQRSHLIERGSSMRWSGRTLPAGAADVERELTEAK